MALCLTIAIKNKASNDEIFGILKDVPNPNQEDDDGKVYAARLWQVVICFVCRLSAILWRAMYVVVNRTVCFSF